MDEQKIIFPAFVIADLYKHSLVESAGKARQEADPEVATTPAESRTSTNGIHYLGENRKLVTVLVNQPDYHFLSDNNLTLLTTIIAACKLRLDDIAIVNMAKEPVNYLMIKKELNALKFLLFDVTPESINLPFKMPSFQVQFFDGCHILLSPDFYYYDDSDSGKNFKRRLWTCLKAMFHL